MYMHQFYVLCISNPFSTHSKYSKYVQLGLYVLINGVVTIFFYNSSPLQTERILGHLIVFRGYDAWRHMNLNRYFSHFERHMNSSRRSFAAVFKYLKRLFVGKDKQDRSLDKCICFFLLTELNLTVSSCILKNLVLEK